jgi:hypothetical protein
MKIGQVSQQQLLSDYPAKQQRIARLQTLYLCQQEQREAGI